MQTEKSQNTRAIVLDMLMEISLGKSFSHIVIKNVLDKYNYMDAKEKAFIKRLTEGTLERQIQLDYIIDSFSGTPVRRMKPFIRCLLRMSVYQLLFMERIPDSAVCNEAVKLAEKRKFHALKGFVNGVLRSIARNKNSIVYPGREDELEKYLSVVYSMPEWIVKLWLNDYGMQTTEEMLKSLLEEHPVTVRLRESLSEQEKKAAVQELKESGVGMLRHPYLPYAYVLTHTEGLGSLEAFRSGKITVQDVSSMFVAECAGIKVGDRVLDVCAAPGGKSLHAADKLLAAEQKKTAATAKPEESGGTELTENAAHEQVKEGPIEEGHIEARDISEDKTDKIQENIDRLGLNNISVKVQDASVWDEASAETADVLFLDVPCSGLGVIGKKRDIKYKADPDKLPELVTLQKEILKTCVPYVKKGGTLIFSTCTVHKEENENLLSYLLSEFPLEPVSLDEHLPKELRSETTAKGYLQFLPGLHQTDGFFLAKLRRVDGGMSHNPIMEKNNAAI